MAHAQSVELVAHNGFEACWPSSLTEPQFLDLLQTSIDGASACIAPDSGNYNGIDYTTCASAACAGGAMGCPVTVRSGAFGGDFSTGAFSAPGSVDDIMVPISYSSGVTSGSCSITVSAMSVTWAPSFLVRADGNNGAYMAYLTAATTVTADNYVLTGSDFICSAMAASGSSEAIKQQVEQAAAAQIVAALSAAHASVCPLTP